MGKEGRERGRRMEGRWGGRKRERGGKGKGGKEEGRERMQSRSRPTLKKSLTLFNSLCVAQTLNKTTASTKPGHSCDARNSSFKCLSLAPNSASSSVL